MILKPMARWASANIPHWDLLMGVLGVNPVSNDGESPTMQLIGAFMKLIGQEEVWENIRKAMPSAVPGHGSRPRCLAQKRWFPAFPGR